MSPENIQSSFPAALTVPIASMKKHRLPVLLKSAGHARIKNRCSDSSAEASSSEAGFGSVQSEGPLGRYSWK